MNDVSIVALVVAPFIVFCVFVAPVWIVFHYLTASRRDRAAKSAPVSPEDQEMTARMIGLLEKMESRIANLEKILDAEEPQWREKRALNERL